MKMDIKGIRKRGREILDGNWSTMVGVYLILVIFVSLSTGTAIYLLITDVLLRGTFTKLSVIVAAICFMSYLVIPSYGYSTVKMSIGMYGGKNVKINEILYGYRIFGKTLGLALYISLLVFLWSLLFFVPGIVAAINYSQSFYILADDYKLGIKECVNRSKALMKGNKLNYFKLQISYIGWIVLAETPCYIAIYCIRRYIVIIVCCILMLIGVSFVRAYISAGNVVFNGIIEFENLKGDEKC